MRWPHSQSSLSPGRMRVVFHLSWWKAVQHCGNFVAKTRCRRDAISGESNKVRQVAPAGGLCITRSAWLIETGAKSLDTTRKTRPCRVAPKCHCRAVAVDCGIGIAAVCPRGPADYAADYRRTETLGNGYRDPWRATHCAICARSGTGIAADRALWGLPDPFAGTRTERPWLRTAR